MTTKSNMNATVTDICVTALNDEDGSVHERIARALAANGLATNMTLAAAEKLATAAVNKWAKGREGRKGALDERTIKNHIARVRKTLQFVEQVPGASEMLDRHNLAVSETSGTKKLKPFHELHNVAEALASSPAAALEYIEKRGRKGEAKPRDLSAICKSVVSTIEKNAGVTLKAADVEAALAPLIEAAAHPVVQSPAQPAVPPTMDPQMWENMMKTFGGAMMQMMAGQTPPAE